MPLHYGNAARRTAAPAIAVAIGLGISATGHQTGLIDAPPLSTGKAITPVGAQTEVGSFPANMALSPDGKWIAVTETGYREHLCILAAATGRLVSELNYSGSGGKQASLYYGLAFGPASSGGVQTLYAARGPEDRVVIYNVAANGTLTPAGKALSDPSPLPKIVGGNFDAGIAISGDGRYCYVTHNMTSAFTDQKGTVAVLDVTMGKAIGSVETPGFPLAVVALTKGPNAGKRIYVTSERDGVVSDIDVSAPTAPKLLRDIPTGDHPMALAFDRSQRRMFVANSGSDTVSIIDTTNDRVVDTLLLRPQGRGLPGATPTGLALSADQTRLYVSMGDLNAVAIVGVSGNALTPLGYVPTGWYPTSVVVSPDGSKLFVANAKGVVGRTPNGVRSGPNGEWGDYIENIIEGTVSTIPVPNAGARVRLTAQVIANNRIHGDLSRANVGAFPNVGIKHVIYIVKENRTYDQILGDIPHGNGDPSLTLFGKDVTPNLHALAERFVLLDNFYCAGEVSADGWTWSTQGMANEYAQRNVPFNYSGRGRYYDFEGQNNGAPVDLLDIPDVARGPGGYIWEDCVKSHIAFRNYGFFVSMPVPFGPNGHALAKDNAPTKKALLDTTDPNFYRFDLAYPDSEAWLKLNAPGTAKRKKWGKFDAPSRYSAWKREFDQYVANGNLPPFEMVRFMRDHTEGTSPGYPTPRGCAADNDFAVGQLVEAVSHSPYWKDTAIFVIEDDAQDGHDHVDCHRSPCYVISPHIKANTIDHHFYNTDSVLRSMEALLGMPPMNSYDAVAPLFSFLRPVADNDAPYDAILPARGIGDQVNRSTAYRAKDSEKLDFTSEDRVPPAILNDIIWHSVKGPSVPEPPIRRIGMAARPTDRE